MLSWSIMSYQRDSLTGSMTILTCVMGTYAPIFELFHGSKRFICGQTTLPTVIWS